MLDNVGASTYHVNSPIEVCRMTKALEEAFRQASKLPSPEQDALAAAIQAEIEAEAEWRTMLSNSQDALGRLADEALSEHKAGRTQPLEPDKR